VPSNYSLAPAYPNPTDGQITFGFTVPQTIPAVLKVVNKKNEVVATIAQGNYVAGVHAISWNANLANDNYRVIFEAGNYTAQGDIQVLK
jgi:flagellar hook assembly protein FlgD